MMQHVALIIREPKENFRLQAARAGDPLGSAADTDIDSPGTLGFFASGENINRHLVHYAVTARHVLVALRCDLTAKTLKHPPRCGNLKFSGCWTDESRDVAWMQIDGGAYECVLPKIRCALEAQDGDPMCCPLDLPDNHWDQVENMTAQEKVTVWKCGAKTETTQGLLQTVMYVSEKGFPKVIVKRLEKEEFSDNGDSGSLYYLKMSDRIIPIGMHLEGPDLGFVNAVEVSKGLRIDAVWEARPLTEEPEFCSARCASAPNITPMKPAAASTAYTSLADPKEDGVSSGDENAI